MVPNLFLAMSHPDDAQFLLFKKLLTRRKAMRPLILNEFPKDTHETENFES